jgi:hypothetical protein
MGLIEKIEEIRKKPDYIKLRYVWFFVIICMILIIAIWFFSLRTDLREMSQKENPTNQKTTEIKQFGSDLIKEIEKQKDTAKNIQSTINPN